MKTFKLIQKFLNNSISKDILQNYWYFNEFESKVIKTEYWYGTDTPQNYLLEGNKKYGFGDVTYHINKYGYRVNPTNNDKNENIIACFGCSNTFGVGLPLNQTWSYLIEKKLNNGFIVKNYGVSGASNDTIARLIFNYTIKYKPKIICCYFPEIFRMELFNNQSKLEFLTPSYGGTNLDPNSSFYKAYKEISSIDNCLFNFIKNFKLIQFICNNNDIKFYWNTWSDNILDMSKQNIINNLDFNSFTGSLYDGDDAESYKLIPDNYEWRANSARDGSHFGELINEKLSDSFVRKIKKDFE
jgi:hypothetical protein